jgi:hypothetical protein
MMEAISEHAIHRNVLAVANEEMMSVWDASTGK